MRVSPRQRFAAPVATRKVMGRESMYHYWHPGRDGVEQAPADVRAELARISPDLRLVRPPMGAPLPTHPWVMWYRRERITHEICPGWLLLFTWQERVADVLQPLPLDSRLYEQLFSASARAAGDARDYFDTLMAAQEAAKAKTAKAHADHGRDVSKDFFETTKIKNIGRGNKFALHHDGTIEPGRGEAAWQAERARTTLPADYLQRQRDDAEQRRALHADR